MTEPLDPIYIEYATDRVLADMEDFSEFLCDECNTHDAVSSDYECRSKQRLTLASIPTQLHAAISAAIDGNVMLAGHALKLVGERYLAHSHDRIISLASAAAVGGNS